MSNDVLVRCLAVGGEDDNPQLQWQQDPDGPLASGTVDQLAEALGEGASVTLLLPGEQVLSLQVEVPGANVRQLRQAAPFVAEEQLTQPVESLHFTLGPVRAEQPVSMLAVDRQWLTGVLERFRGCGLKLARAFADWQALPVGEVVNLASEARVLAHTDHWRGFAAEADLAGMLLDQPVPDAISDTQAFARLRAGLASETTSGLLHDDFAPSDASSSGRVWFAVAGLAAVVLIAHISLTLLDVWRLQSASDDLRQQQAEVLRQTFPDLARVSSDPYGQMQSLLQQLRVERGEHGGGQWFAFMTPTAKSLADDRDTRVQRIHYRGQTLELEVSTGGIPQLDALRERLARAHADMSVEIASVNQDGDRANGRLLITRRGS